MQEKADAQKQGRRQKVFLPDACLLWTVGNMPMGFHRFPLMILTVLSMPSLLMLSSIWWDSMLPHLRLV